VLVYRFIKSVVGIQEKFLECFLNGSFVEGGAWCENFAWIIVNYDNLTKLTTILFMGNYLNRTRHSGES